MHDALVQIYIHFVWGTWDRLPVITTDNEKQVYQNILDQCKKMNCSVIAIGGTTDHMHLCVRFSSTVSVANFVKEVKGSTSHLITHHLNQEDFFKWQAGYAAFSVGISDVSRIKSYIEHQKDHHNLNQLNNAFEL